LTFKKHNKSIAKFITLTSAPQVIVRMITLVQELLPDRLRNTAFKKQPESDPLPGSTRNTNTAFLKLPRG
jgi:hypothetical protein